MASAPSQSSLVSLATVESRVKVHDSQLEQMDRVLQQQRVALSEVCSICVSLLLC
jgi:hypothetical protein